MISGERRHEGLPYVEAYSKVRVPHYMLVADSRTGVPWSCLVERVPVSDGRNFKEFKECEANGNCQPKEHVKEGLLGCIHVGVNVE